MKDQFNLERFIIAQNQSYKIALKEMKAGRKESHWMWYIFPQIKGLGNSAISQYYSIGSLEEAKLYMQNEVLRNHLLEISETILQLPASNPTALMGYPDNLKLHSSMTLFAYVAPQNTVFQQVLNKYFNGVPDSKTIAIIKEIKQGS